MGGWKQEAGEQPKIGMVGGRERKQKVKGREVICQGYGCKCKRWAMRLDPQHKPYGALMVQFRDKYWSPGVNTRSQGLKEVTELGEQGNAEEVGGIWDWQGCKTI